MADAEREVDDVRSGDVLSVQELNERIASAIEETPPLHSVRCIGEVTDFHQNSTALYFTLTDGDAELPCMIWANRYRNMDAKLEDGTEVILEDDIDYWTDRDYCRDFPVRPHAFVRSIRKGPTIITMRAGKSTSSRGR